MVKMIDNDFIKFVDNEDNICYKQNGFNFDKNKLVAMNLRLYEDS